MAPVALSDERANAEPCSRKKAARRAAKEGEIRKRAGGGTESVRSKQLSFWQHVVELERVLTLTILTLTINIRSWHSRKCPATHL
jgi:hypothetical protein